MKCSTMLKSFWKDESGVSMIELGLSMIILVPFLFALTGFSTQGLEKSGISRGATDAIGIWSVGLKNGEDGAGVSGAAFSALQAASAASITDVRATLVQISMTSSTQGVELNRFYFGAFVPGVPPQIGINAGNFVAPGALTLSAGDTVYVLEVWRRHSGSFGPLSPTVPSYAARIVLR